MCKQLSTQEELLTHDEMKGVTLTADKLLYLHAIDLCLNAASLEFFGKAQEVRNCLSTRMTKVKFCVCVVYWTIYSSPSLVSQFKSTGNHRL